MLPLYPQLISLLIDLEYELRRAHLWAAYTPTDAVLNSVEPFGIDTMTFQEWLQFVFLPRMHLLLEQELPLPEACNIAAMAETVWAGTPAAKPVIVVLRALDNSINDQA